MMKPAMTRRALLGSAVLSVPAIRALAATRSRPNILFALADDWSWPFASLAGNKTVKTPNFDRVAREGVLFPQAYCVAPSCTASRASILTGQWFARLEGGANLLGALSTKFDVYPDILERAGYAVGFTGKGWGPGDYRPGGRTRNPAGPAFQDRKLTPPTAGISNIDYTGNFADFLATRSAGQPFCFWYGGNEPHRPYEVGSGLKAGKNLADVQLPGGLPDVPEARSDLLDYALEIDWFDSHLGKMISMLEKAGELDNTIIVVSGDNGLPFPRAKANDYDDGTHIPLAIRWGARIRGGRTVEDFVSLADLAPTFLEAAGLKPTAAMTARSLMSILTSVKSGRIDPKRDHIFTGRERHNAAAQPKLGSYPIRALRTTDYLYIRNYDPDRLPAGTEISARPRPGATKIPSLPPVEPGKAYPLEDGTYGDIDAGPTKTYMEQHQSDSNIAGLFDLAFGKRPAEELYVLHDDAKEQKNRADDPTLAAVRSKLAAELDQQLKAWGDPRALGNGDVFDKYPTSAPIAGGVAWPGGLTGAPAPAAH